MNLKKIAADFLNGALGRWEDEGGYIGEKSNEEIDALSCDHCDADVWWSFPQPDDPCYECGKPIKGPA